MKQAVQLRAQARLDEADANLKLLQAGSWQPEITIAEAEVAQADINSKVRAVDDVMDLANAQFDLGCAYDFERPKRRDNVSPSDPRQSRSQ